MVTRICPITEVSGTAAADGETLFIITYYCTL